MSLLLYQILTKRKSQDVELDEQSEECMSCVDAEAFAASQVHVAVLTIVVNYLFIQIDFTASLLAGFAPRLELSVCVHSNML